MAIAGGSRSHVGKLKKTPYEKYQTRHANCPPMSDACCPTRATASHSAPGSSANCNVHATQ